MSYSFIAEHASMVFDDRRNAAYAQALRERSMGSVVIDLGAGLGIHGLIAAAAGAAHVYLVEPQPVVHIAGAVAAANGLADRVSIVQERIEDATLPEKADLLVSVFTGNMLFSEDLLPALFDARDRYLKDAGAMIPDRAQLLVAPISAPELHARYVGRWAAPVMGIDYSSVRRFATNEPLVLSREELGRAVPLASGALMADLDLMRARSSDCSGDAFCAIETSGTCDGLICWIRIRVGTTWLSTEPEAPAMHWSAVHLPIDPPLRVEAGEQLRVQLQRPAYGDWTWTVSSGTDVRRHSTFLGAADGPLQWRRVEPDAAAGLDAGGRRAHFVLDAMARRLTNRAIAEELARAEGISVDVALRHVQSLALRYGDRR
jgi:predicted RNA methylase